MFDSQSTAEIPPTFTSKVTFPFNSRKCIEESRGVVDYIKYVRKVKERFFCLPVRSISHTLITSFRLLLSDQSPEKLERSLNLELADSFIVDQAGSSTQPGPSSRNAQPGPSGSNTRPGPSVDVQKRTTTGDGASLTSYFSLIFENFEFESKVGTAIMTCRTSYFSLNF